MGRLQDKVAIVTGGAAGIGASMCKIFASEGAKVIAVDMGGSLGYEAENVEFYKLNVTDSLGCKALCDYAIDKYGKIDILVNVAGVAPKVRNDILEMTEESYDFVMNINTKGTLFLTQAVANIMKENKEGSIVNISSMSGYTSSVSRGEYCISKAGISMATKLFAARLAEYGISVIEIRPGIIETDMTAKVKEKYEEIDNIFIEDGDHPDSENSRVYIGGNEIVE